MRFRVEGAGAWACLATGLGALLMAPSAARAQFSPGPLARVHAAWDKTTACLECHEPKRATTAERCLACHEELRARITARRGYHGRNRARATECAPCHADHGGRDAALVTWPDGRDSFDHGLTGYTLEGKHAQIRCRACHIAALTRAPDVRTGPTAKSGVTYLGLSSRCSECHGDIHRGQFDAAVAGGDCAACHTAYGWGSVTVDHEKTRFPLRGRHAIVSCERCHYAVTASGARADAGEANAFVRYHPLPHDACADCHIDPHKSRYGGECARCHSTAGWGAIALGAFDHERTRYPLRGLHRSVACERCHGAGDFKKRIAFSRCSDCHSDRHGGQLARSLRAGACDACHSLEGFAPPRYGINEHERTRFPLRGAHRAVACASCHEATANGAPRGDVRFRLKATACADCHKDAHASQFAGSPGGAECSRCHSDRAWRGVAFDHRKTAFPLEGGHERAACAACHRIESIRGHRTIRYRPIETKCRVCHAAPPPENRRST